MKSKIHESQSSKINNAGKKIATTVTLILAVLTVNVNAQGKNVKGGPKTAVFAPRGGNTFDPGTQNNSGNQNAQSNWQTPGGNNVSGSVTLAFGNYPPSNYGGYYGPNYYNGAAYYGGGYYNGYGSIKKNARYTLATSRDLINRSIDLHNWNDIYSPILAKAIRHHNFAKQMYYWGNYGAAIKHAERARYLAWYSLQYFQNPGYYNNGGYYSGADPGPYADPNDPYWRKSNSGNGQKTAPPSGNKKQALPEPDDLDNKLPNENINDKELIRSFDTHGGEQDTE
jgi:hypothetical protein